MGNVIIKAPRIFDGKKLITDREGVLILENEKIRYAGFWKNAPAVKGTEFEFENATIMPGLIDAHVHLTMDGSGDPVSKAEQDSIPTASFRALNSAKKLIKKGITSVRDCGSQGYIAVRLSEAVENGLVNSSPKIVACGPALCMTGGHGAFIGMEADGADEMRKAVRTVVKNGAGAIKLITTGGVLTKGTAAGATQLTFEELKAAVEEAHKAGLRTTTHAHATDGIKIALRAGVDSIDHSSYLDDEIIDLYYETGAYYIPTLISSIRQMEHLDEIPGYIAEKIKRHIDRETDSVERLIAAQVPMGAGTDAGTPFNEHGDLAYQLYLLSQHGLNNEKALYAGTLGAAKALGIDQTTGSLEPEKAADVLVAEGNPVENIRDLERVLAVWRDGKKMT